MSEHNAEKGIAALSICEALLLALNDAKVLPEQEIVGVLEDAATSHENAGGSNIEIKEHEAVATLIRSRCTPTLGGCPLIVSTVQKAKLDAKGSFCKLHDVSA